MPESVAPDTEEVAEPAAPVSQPTQPPVEVTEVGTVLLATDWCIGTVAGCGLGGSYWLVTRGFWRKLVASVWV